jgi:hypothetical protein
MLSMQYDKRRSLLSRMSEQVYAASRSSARSNAMYSTKHNSKDVVSEAIARSKKHNESTTSTTIRKVTNHASILSIPQSQRGIKHFGSSTPLPSPTNRHRPPNAIIPTCARIFCHCNASPAKKIRDYALQSAPRERCRAARDVVCAKVWGNACRSLSEPVKSTSGWPMTQLPCCSPLPECTLPAGLRA